MPPDPWAILVGIESAILAFIAARAIQARLRARRRRTRALGRVPGQGSAPTREAHERGLAQIKLGQTRVLEALKTRYL